VAVHDGVRPFVAIADIENVVHEAERSAAAILAVPIVDTVKQAEKEFVQSTLTREHLVLAQTPQVFRYDLLVKAFQLARQDGFIGTDESSMVERLDVEVSVVMGSDRNIKITRPGDMELAHRPARRRKPGLERIRTGRLGQPPPAAGRLSSWGVTIPSELGLEGHSDADVPAHAITDAILARPRWAIGGRTIPTRSAMEGFRQPGLLRPPRTWWKPPAIACSMGCDGF
jgi:hypothetical protein